MAIYKGLEATLHEAFWGDRGSDLEVEDILRFFPEFSGEALEVGAGSGRILKKLSDASWKVEGIEPSPEMVEMYQAERDDDLIKACTLEDYESAKKYDLILFTSYVFQILENPAETFKRIENLLKDKGSVYLSLMIPWAEIVGELIEGEWSLDDEVRLPDRKKARCWVNFDLDRINQKLVRCHRYEIIEKKKVLESTKTEQYIRWFTLPEFTLLLEKHGFKITAQSYEFKEEYDSDAHSLGFVLEKI